MLSRRFAAVPTDALAGILPRDFGAAAVFLAVEQTQWPQRPAMARGAALGIAPVGALLPWDIGVARDTRVGVAPTWRAALDLFLVRPVMGWNAALVLAASWSTAAAPRAKA